MKTIEFSLAAVMSLQAPSSAGSDEVEEIDEDVEETTEEDVLSMSDDEFEKMSPEDFEQNQDGQEDDTLGDGDEEEEDSDVNEDEQEATAEANGSEQTEDNSESDGDQPTEEDMEQRYKEYEAAYKRLFEQPIKASGRQVHIKGVDHAQSLIEMGVDYNKKMQYMRPHMQALKTLEKQGLLENQDELNLLLEAKAGKPEAIKKLLAQNELDPMDLADFEDSADATSYKPENHMVSQAEVEIEQALLDIKESPSYQKTIDVMSNSLDSKSKEIISENPDYIRSLNDDIENGIYDQVMEMVQYGRDTKQIPSNVSDIEAYIATVQQMAARQQEQPPAEIPTPEPANDQRPARRSTGASKRRKAAMSGTRSSRKKEQDFDPLDILGISDEEFEKKFGGQLL